MEKTFVILFDPMVSVTSGFLFVWDGRKLTPYFRIFPNPLNQPYYTGRARILNARFHRKRPDTWRPLI